MDKKGLFEEFFSHFFISILIEIRQPLRMFFFLKIRKKIGGPSVYFSLPAMPKAVDKKWFMLIESVVHFLTFSHLPIQSESTSMGF